MENAQSLLAWRNNFSFSYIKTLRDKKLSELSRQIGKLDQRYAQHPTPSLYNERAFLLSEYNLISTSHAEHLLLKSKHHFYEFGDKPGKALALQLRLQTAKSLIAQIKTPVGNIVSDPQEINNQFIFFILLCISQIPSKILILLIIFLKILMSLKSVMSQKLN